MNAFRIAMGDLWNIVDEVQVGGGPNGEARYPSFPSNKWKLPGVGAFQAFDPLFL
jgi:hypothetical protein